VHDGSESSITVLPAELRTLELATRYQRFDEPLGCFQLTHLARLYLHVLLTPQRPMVMCRRHRHWNGIKPMFGGSLDPIDCADADNVRTEPELAARAVPLPPSPKPAWSHAKLGFSLSL